MQIKYNLFYNYIYEQYTGVSGLNINVSKTTALCINTVRDVQEGLERAGLSLTTSAKHLGIHLAPTKEATIDATIAAIDPKAIERRILATTPPTDMLHRALLVNLAFTVFQCTIMSSWLFQSPAITLMSCKKQF
jgi:hypothetical protein